MKKKIIWIIFSLFVVFFSFTKNASAASCSGPGDTSCGSGFVCVKYPTSGVYVCMASSNSGSSNTGNPGSTNQNGSTNATVNTAGGNSANVLCDGNTGIQTAVGCIHALSTQNAFASDILKWAIGVGSGIAFLLILYGGFMVMSSAGNPDRLKAGQELLTSAISGLILLIFCVFILNFIGINILGIFS